MITKKIDMEADVVIIGFGGAGAAAAITAYDNGAEVIIIEKMSYPGGNTRLSGGNIAMPRRSQDISMYADYLKVVCYNNTEPEIVDAYVKGLVELPQWFKTMGIELVEIILPAVSYTFNVPHPTHPGVPFAKDLDLVEMSCEPTESAPGLAGGGRLWDQFIKQVESRKIKVLLSTRANVLVKNRAGEVVGVVAESNGKNILIRAKKGVIMACGGFENNDALKWDNLMPKPFTFVGNPGNTGDGIRMAIKAGAALWHMNLPVAVLGTKPDGFEAGFAIQFFAPGFIFVDKYGRRFASETDIECHDYWRICNHFDNLDHYDYPRVPFYVIFDEEVRRAAPFIVTEGGYNTIVEGYEWSLDNSEEVKKGWIIKAKNIRDLAERLSMNPQTLENTVSNYNACCKDFYDSEFNRPKESLKAIVGSPVYAIEVGPMLINTQGGARRDKEARVLDPDGKPIPRLYSAGEFGSVWGFLYEAATNFAEAFIFGRIAGKNAACAPSLSDDYDNQ
ncbi:MAG: FAD-binding protein [Deltaproteobacteria bacterium]|nr:FAD-binding protein [Deltaproteobacteria bacterium]